MPKNLIEENKAPFSLAGIALGATKADIQKKGYALFSCREEGQDNAECLFSKGEAFFGFFGVEAKSPSYSFLKPYTNVTGITLYTEGPATIDMATVENTWQLKGRCLSGNDVSQIVKNGDEFDPGIVGKLQDAKVLPYGEGFICLGKDNRFISVSAPIDKNDPRGSVNIYYLRDDLVELFGYLFEDMGRHQKATDEIHNTLEASGAN